MAGRAAGRIRARRMEVVFYAGAWGLSSATIASPSSGPGIGSIWATYRPFAGGVISPRARRKAGRGKSPRPAPN